MLLGRKKILPVIFIASIHLLGLIIDLFIVSLVKFTIRFTNLKLLQATQFTCFSFFLHECYCSRDGFTIYEAECVLLP